MKKTKNAERIDRIKRESDKLHNLVNNKLVDNFVIEQVRNLVKIVDEAVAECNNEMDNYIKEKDYDLGRWNIVNLTSTGVSLGYHAFRNGQNTIVKEITQATEFMSKKEAERIANQIMNQIGKTYIVVGFPSLRK